MYIPPRDFVRCPTRLPSCPEGWNRVNALDIAAWTRYAADLRAVLRYQSAITGRTIFCGPFGEDEPIIDAAQVAFNGNLLGRHWITEQRRVNPAYGRASEDCDDAHEQFIIQRVHDDRRDDDTVLHQEITTAGKPYSIGVRAALLLIRHHFPTTTRLCLTSSSPAEWQEAINHIQNATGDHIVMPPELPALFPPRHRQHIIRPSAQRAAPCRSATA